MNILAVDTSTSVLNVTVKTEKGLIDFCEESGSSQHSERLLPVIIEKCKESGLELKDFDLLICTRGPGSFTGLRIAMSCLKGLSYGLDKPLVSVSTLQAYAESADINKGKLVVALDAKKQRYYLAVFNTAKDVKTRITDDIDGNIEQIAGYLVDEKSIYVTGPDAEAFAEKMNNYFKGTKEIKIVSSVKSFGSVLVDLGIKQLNEKGPDDIGQGPVYIRKSDAEVALEERLKNN